MLPDSSILLLALAVAGIGAVSIARVLTGVIEQETRLHDTKVRVAELQLKYIERARAFRASVGAADDDAPIEVGEAGDTEP